MPSVAAKAVTAADESAAVDAVVLSFAGDPVARWTWTQADRYLAAMPRFVRAFGGRAFAHGTACCTEGCSGAALWLPPGVVPDERALVDVLQSTVEPEHLADVVASFEQMAQFHPEGPHWYLPLIGVDPAYQGRGHGDALMRYALARCDRDRLPAYLESTNPRNVSLYVRHGFEPLGEIQVGSSPMLIPMLRQPR
jgi:ribosomal protein S18 acetylase RimI-like enzyme